MNKIILNKINLKIYRVAWCPISGPGPSFESGRVRVPIGHLAQCPPLAPSNYLSIFQTSEYGFFKERVDYNQLLEDDILCCYLATMVLEIKSVLFPIDSPQSRFRTK